MARIGTRIDAALEELERNGTLNPAQRAAVAERVTRALRTGRGFDFAAIVATFGALLVAAGLLYLIGYNWELLSKGAKLLLIFGVWGALHAAGWLLAERRGTHPRVGRALTLLGVLCFGGAIGLVAQIYHLSAHYPNAILSWWLLSVPIVLVTRSRAILATVMAIGIVWVGWHLGVWLEDRERLDERVWIACFALVGVGVAATFEALATLAGRTDPARLDRVLRLPVLALAGAAPFVLAFHDPWWDEPVDGDPASAYLPVAVALAIAAVLLGIAAWRRGIASARDGGILIALGAALCLNAVLAPRALPVTANIVLFAGALGLVALGQREGRQSLGVWGILLFVTGVLARYFEYLWDKLEGAYAFLATGILLMAAAYVFENRRRALAARTRGVAS